DLILFARGDSYSVAIIMKALDEFKNVSCLEPSILKSIVFFCNVVNHTKTSILQLISFKEGTLHMKYLGVPLISSRLLYKDCKILVERVQKRIGDWKNKWLSFAGRFKLCVMQHGKAKVAWRDGCFPKMEEGLGICKLESFNIALMASRIWKIFNDKEFLWVCWIHSYKLIDRSLWDVKVRGSVSWGWRKLLSI
nr:hypothetical protein [Tanacetum cinerariifolium]